ncbi:MAG: phosphatidylserine decarboxylase [Ruminococcaceae bacterium]|nr:phosphatidylserine decarboxylase [Oscillospiraceae bacterium]
MNNKNNESVSLRFLYGNPVGRLALKLLTARWISKLCGVYLDSPLSKSLIKKFVSKNNIDLNDFEADNFKCFNDCFCRKIKEGKRPIDEDESELISPCDGLLSAYHINDDTVIPVKQSRYSISSLLENEELAKEYKDGICLVFRLCVNHYHRYCYPMDGEKGENIFIKGKLHTVRPIALEVYPVFTRNCREYTVIETEKHGKLLQMEVGAMLVGKIKNLHGKGRVMRGEEKGMFLYGGSTVIMLIQKDRAVIDEKLFINTEKEIETPILMGQRISKI